MERQKKARAEALLKKQKDALRRKSTQNRNSSLQRESIRSSYNASR